NPDRNFLASGPVLSPTRCWWLPCNRVCVHLNSWRLKMPMGKMRKPLIMSVRCIADVLQVYGPPDLCVDYAQRVYVRAASARADAKGRVINVIVPEHMEWIVRDRFGLFIHWGIYSV